jgi:polyisoprenoid-binding protein YceI
MSIMLRVVLALVIVISSCAASADPAAGIGGDRAQPLPLLAGAGVLLDDGLYEIQQQTSKMVFRVDSPIGDVWASFQDFEGVFTMLNHEGWQDMAAIEINANSLDTDGGLIGMLLKSRSFFDVENFPSMRFTGDSLEWYGDRRAVLKGQMTIKGVTRQVAFYVEVVDHDADSGFLDQITVKATTTIRRSEFGIDSMLPAVSDNVNLFMSIDAVKKAAVLSMH